MTRNGPPWADGRTSGKDETVEKIIRYSGDFWNAPIDADVTEAALIHLVDSVACAVAGHATDSARSAIEAARGLSSSRPATVFGSGFSSAPAHAVFANTVMVRSLDWNDGMLAPGGGHPSDMIPAILAAAEVTGASGAETVRAIVLAYEVLGSLGAHIDRVALELDQGLFMGVATVVATGMLHGFGESQLAHAIGMVLVSAIPIQATRRGPLSMWKGAATASATMHATNVVRLAAAGMTGPAYPFEGVHGLMSAITGPFDLQIPAYPGGKAVVQISHQKMFPAESHSQALLGVVPEILDAAPVAEITSIEVEAYKTLVDAIGSHPSVWDPQTRETADHSLPYLLAAALTDGTVTPASFTAERIADPTLRPLMAKIRIRENPEFTDRYRPKGMELAGAPEAHIVVSTSDGRVLERRVTYPKGHSMNPMDRGDIDRKLDAACGPMIASATRERIRAAWWGMLEAPSASAVIRTIADFAVVEGNREPSHDRATTDETEPL